MRHAPLARDAANPLEELTLAEIATVLGAVVKAGDTQLLRVYQHVRYALALAEGVCLVALALRERLRARRDRKALLPQSLVCGVQKQRGVDPRPGAPATLPWSCK